jgi:hypothetical protein
MTLRRFALAAVLLAVPAVQAASGDATTEALKACRAVSDNTARLACFDRLTAGLDAQAPVAATTPAAVAAPQAAAAAPVVAQQASAAPVAQAAPPRQGTSWYDPGAWFGSDTSKPARPMAGNPANFGGENLAAVEDKEPLPLDRITVPVAKVSFNAIGHFIVTLENGQVWRQIDADTAVARFHKDKKETVTIKRGFMDAYSLSIDGQWGNYMVKRIK